MIEIIKCFMEINEATEDLTSTTLREKESRKEVMIHAKNTKQMYEFTDFMNEIFWNSDNEDVFRQEGKDSIYVVGTVIKKTPVSVHVDGTDCHLFFQRGGKHARSSKNKIEKKINTLMMEMPENSTIRQTTSLLLRFLTSRKNGLGNMEIDEYLLREKIGQLYLNAIAKKITDENLKTIENEILNVKSSRKEKAENILSILTESDQKADKAAENNCQFVNFKFDRPIKNAGIINSKEKIENAELRDMLISTINNTFSKYDIGDDFLCEKVINAINFVFQNSNMIINMDLRNPDKAAPINLTERIKTVYDKK